MSAGLNRVCEPHTFATWRSAESSIPAPTRQALSTLEWIGRAENLAVAGPSGTGKSHFVEALAHTAIEADLRVAWFSAVRLPGGSKATGQDFVLTIDTEQLHHVSHGPTAVDIAEPTRIPGRPWAPRLTDSCDFMTG
jgi:hypothetical protein